MSRGAAATCSRLRLAEAPYWHVAQVVGSVCAGYVLTAFLFLRTMVCQLAVVCLEALSQQLSRDHRERRSSCLDCGQDTLSERASPSDEAPLVCTSLRLTEGPLQRSEGISEAVERPEASPAAPALSSDVAVPSASLSACSSGCRADLDLVESVEGLEGLKMALASRFMHQSTLPEDFRLGYVVDLDQHWVTVHAMFTKSHVANTLSLVVFDTLEVNYQHYYDVGLLRTSHLNFDDELGLRRQISKEDDSLDVATLCEMRDIQYEISFLAPTCDMRRLTWEEEEEIRAQKKSVSPSRPSTVYYDRNGNPFRKIIVQPVLQSERDGTCKSRALAALGWLLSLDEEALTWYVTSTRQLFHVTLRAHRGGSAGRQRLSCGGGPVPEDVGIFGSLMSTGRRDKFGRDVHMKVCHTDTRRYNRKVEEGCPTTTQRRCLPDCGEHREALLPSDSEEVLLRCKREAELAKIREVLLRTPASQDDEDDGSQELPSAMPCNMRRWREIDDHEARWSFLEETCFFGHNLGLKKIRKKYPKEELLVKAVCAAGSGCGADMALAAEETSLGFDGTQYLRKYMLDNNCVTHEADRVFQEPFENFFSFLCTEEEDVATLPFYVLPFPGCFMALSLEDYVQPTNTLLDLEGDPDERCRQKVSDYSIPTGNTFLNHPIAYNKQSSIVSLPVKISAIG